MDDVDSLLKGAGERWRAAQPAPPDVDGRMLTAARPRLVPANRSVLGALRLAAIGVAAALVIALAATEFRLDRNVGGPSGAASAPGSAGPAGLASCAVTRPAPPFVPPRPYPSAPPDLYASDWFGSSGLWTMLDRDGEIWAGADLPQDADGFSQKTFWWSAAWTPGAEPEPAITVVGTRLDGTGTFEVSGGTNASADFGTAMLVGVVFPTAGCWQVTGRYRDATLSYVVSIRD